MQTLTNTNTDYFSDLSNSKNVIPIERYQILSTTHHENILFQQHNELIKLLEVLNKNGFNNDFFDDSLYTISTETKQTASFIFSLILKNHINMPLIHPDEEQGLVMTWRNKDISNILIVDSKTLHFSMELNPGCYENIDNIPLDTSSLSKSGEIHSLPLQLRKFIIHLKKNHID